MDNVYCTGTESTLTSCMHTTNHNCEHYEDAGVRCTSTLGTSKCGIYNRELRLHCGVL